MEKVYVVTETCDYDGVTSNEIVGIFHNCAEAAKVMKERKQANMKSYPWEKIIKEEDIESKDYDMWCFLRNSSNDYYVMINVIEMTVK